MVDPVGICQGIITLVVAISRMVSTFKTNNEDCDKIRDRLKTVQELVEPLKRRQLDKRISEALKGLEEALKRSKTDVETCQKKCTPIRGYIEAKSISKDLQRVHENIKDRVETLNLAINICNESALNNVEKALANIHEVLGDQQKKFVHLLQQIQHRPTTYACDQKKNERGTNKTEVADRSKFKDQKNNVLLADTRATRATDVKRVDGQGHPPIVTKMSKLTADVSMTGVTSIDMHPTRPWIVMGDMGGSFYIWDYNRKETVMKRLVRDSSEYNRIKEKTANHWFCSVKFIRKDNCLVVGNWWGSIRLYQYNNTNKLIEDKKFKVPREQPVTLLAVHPTKRYLLSASAYGTKIHLWDLNSNNWKIEREFDVKYAGAGAGAKGVLSLKFDPRDSNNFSCITDKGFMVGNIRSYSLTIKQTGLFKDHYFFSRTDLHFLVILSSDSHNAKIKDYETRDTVATFDMRERRMRFVAGHPTHPLVVIVLDDGTLCSWDGRNLQARAR